MTRPMSECVDRTLYRLISRNLTLGVYNAATHGFTGIRQKYDYFYAFEEYHWDTGAPFGTAHPYDELLEKLPDNIALVTCIPPGPHNDPVGWDDTNKPLWEWLCAMEKRYQPDLAAEREKMMADDEQA